ncbi:phosphatidylcholine:ceramide cholinephosphotransferase 2 isoform X2 [Danio rerio]|uniref:Phosphatidylcholine:ceramide cholinephosphotransferase 2 isoform X2 n=1 Tax=Danio rerio TaxID=7955 RepID=A0AC58J3D5_DANRE
MGKKTCEWEDPASSALYVFCERTRCPLKLNNYQFTWEKHHGGLNPAKEASHKIFKGAIVARRYFFLLGTLYMYRCITMYVTTLPVPGMHMVCAPKLHGDSEAKLQRVLQLLSGGGLSINGSHLLCGDFLYSGHTVILTLTYLFLKEYSPRSFWWYHLLCWLTAAVGVVCILVAHEHYSVDVVVAYFITTRLFYWYHTMANLQTLKCSPNNYLTHTWWNPVFNLFERNVQTHVPCSFCWPITWPPACLKNPCKKYSMVQSGREE